MNLEEFKKLLRRMVLEEALKSNHVPLTEKDLAKAGQLVDKKPKQLKDVSKPEVMGDPLEDVELNQMVDDCGSDEDAAAAVGVKPGKEMGGTGPTAGQATAKFVSKTKAPDGLPK